MTGILPALITGLVQGRTLVAATILARKGSAPRAAGSRMLLERDGPRLRIAAGSVGGGPLEARVAAEAEGLAPGARRVLDYELTGDMAAGEGMICGGRVRVLLEHLGPGDLPLWRELDRILAGGRSCLRLAPLGGGPAALLARDGAVLAGSLPPDMAQAVQEAGRDLREPALLELRGISLALEPWIPAVSLYVFGAGHVSLPTADLAARCGFAVTVLDDRPEFANAERFPLAETRVLPSFADCFAGLPVNPEACVAILTRGHLHDAEVLAQALGARAGYVGMIGSCRKREAIFARLRSEGFTEADLARVHCPVGLPIGAETPEEIAVSILAELIAHRAKRTARGRE